MCGVRGHAVVGVEAEIAVTPVQRPRPRGLGVAQPSDRDAPQSDGFLTSSGRRGIVVDIRGDHENRTVQVRGSAMGSEDFCPHS